MKTFIYVIKDPNTLEVRYVGQTSRGVRRFKQHIDNCNKKQPISCYVRSLLKENLQPIFEIIEHCSLENIDEREIFWIAHYGKGNLLNLTDGGKTTRGYKMPREIVERLRKLPKAKPWLGKKMPKEAREKMSKAKQGMYLGENNPFFGKKHDEATLEKIKKNRKDIVSVYCNENGKTYFSLSEAARDLNLWSESITRQLNGRQKTVKGYTFKKVNYGR